MESLSELEDKKSYLELFRDTAEDEQESLIVWYDQTVDTVLDDLMKKHKFRQISQYIQTFDNIKQCKEYVRQIPFERIILVTSTNNEDNRKLIDDLVNCEQIYSIFVYKSSTGTITSSIWEITCKNKKVCYLFTFQ